MIAINNHLTGTVGYYSLFRFTFKFVFVDTVPASNFYQNLENNIVANQKKAVGNNFIGNSFFPNSCTFTIASNVSDVLEVTKDYYNNKLIFEYAEFSDQQELYPDTNQIATSFAVILKSCLDLINQYASNQPSRNVMVDLDFFFISNAVTYYSSSHSIWGIQVTQNLAGIVNGVKFNEKLQSQTIPVNVLRKFVQMYICARVNGFQNVDIDLSIAQATWNNVFKKINVLRRVVEFIRRLFVR